MPINYIDIGCSGGPKQIEIINGKNFYIGIDPLIHEIQRLKQKYQKFENTEFIAGFAGSLIAESPKNSNYHLEFLAPFYAADLMMCKADITSFQEASAKLQKLRSRRICSAREIQNTSFNDYWQNSFSMNKKEYSDKIVSFHDIEKIIKNENPCILKIDTDGCEFPVLEDWDASNLNSRTFGIDIELQMHGGCSERSSTFSNVDIFLRKRGFVLTSMEMVEYSNAALPSAFKYEIPADAMFGTPQWANCTYTRLLPIIEQSADQVTADNILSIAEFFGLKGWTAEIVFLMYQLGFISTDQAKEKLNKISIEENNVDWTTLHRVYAADPINCRYHKKYKKRDAMNRIILALKDLISLYRN